MKVIKIYIFTMLIACTSAHAMQINQATMQQASQELTTKEAQALKEYLHTRLTQLQRDGLDELMLQEKAKLEKIVDLFYQHRYEKVLQDLSAMGYNPQEILHSSALRTAMLMGTLEQTPWFLREIAGLDWFFERDARRTRKKWPKAQDKLAYVISLVDQLERNYSKVFDQTLIREAIDALEKHSMILSSASSKTLKTRFADILARLDKIRTESGVTSTPD